MQSSTVGLLWDPSASGKEYPQQDKDSCDTAALPPGDQLWGKALGEGLGSQGSSFGFHVPASEMCYNQNQPFASVPAKCWRTSLPKKGTATLLHSSLSTLFFFLYLGTNRTTQLLQNLTGASRADATEPAQISA